jgi:hypothetical protein
MVEGYHEHQYSPENQEAALYFMDHFNNLEARQGLPPVKELDAKTLQCTRTGQVLIDHPDGHSLMEVIGEYYQERKHKLTQTISQLYYGDHYPEINTWLVKPYAGVFSPHEIRWEAMGNSRFDDISIDKYSLHHSEHLDLPLLHIHRSDNQARRMLLWFSNNGKATATDWPEILKYLNEGYDVITFDFRGLGETRMPFKATSIDDPALAQLDFDHAYMSPISGVLADYVYNSLLIGRPYFLQMIEDAEISSRFAQTKLRSQEISVTARGEAYTLAYSIAEVIRGIKLRTQPGERIIKWSEIVERRRELWPIQYLLPDGAYIR